ncbi:TlpA disulfide reductase family protein [Flavobacterium sp.]|uniref:TlpA family protein disulfide reductase n=1 Tax=Flavobacterium sp. TaxID=239 RepID=UPI0026243C39|nr:TlpA disulfide reductase family protein [Flavobacterium sp.]
MKKFSIILIAFISNFSFATDKVTISGKITNTTIDEFTFNADNFKSKIELNKNGEFSYSFDLKYVGIYTIYYNEHDIKLYLAKGSNIIINANEKDFLNSLTFKGKFAIENNYLIKKQLVITKIINTEEELYRLNEKDFLEKITTCKSEIIKLYNATKFQDSYFKSHEFKNIEYLEAYFLKVFNSFHNTDDGKSTLSEKFPKNKIVFDSKNVEDYLFSEVYTAMTDSEYYNYIENLYKNSKQSSKIRIQIEEVKKIKNEFLKNKILKSLQIKISLSNPDLEYLYNELMLIITDENWKNEITKNYNSIKKLVEGTPSPTFNYENYKGGKTSLESLKGKYVYIDVWATWCGPCRREIPSLQKVEEQYEGKNIEFVSLSIDAKKDYEKWKKFVDEKKLGGIQLFADNDWNSQFAKDYAIEGIPRFILIDPNGNIVSADAPRPSDPKLIQKFTELGIK